MAYYQPFSFWEKETYFGKADVAIIGAGIVGMNAALRLREQAPSIKIVIVERASIGTAASSRNAGFACFGSPSEIFSDLESMPEENVVRLIKRRIDGLSLLKNTVGDKVLKYERTGGHEVFLDSESFELHLAKLDQFNKLLNEINHGLRFYPSSRSRGVHNIAGIISNDWEGQIHPGSMTLGLRRMCEAKQIRILLNVEVERIEKENEFNIIADGLSLAAEKIIVCNNAFAGKLSDVTTEPGRNQVLVTSPIENLQIRGCYHYDKGYIYFRNIGNRVLIGGGRNIDMSKESTDQFGSTEKIKSYLLDVLDDHVLKDQSFEIEHEWSGILGFNTTKEPHVQEVSPGKFVAVGLGGMGVAIGSLVGQEVADLLLQS